ncbi:hypothetical protein DMH12_24790 [Streptomyces sp. WAC 04229]|uniref:hypothetical protein n=1 Tax=Streptomyces sp. WAC 04229 TaxID=2203206 RepID=UPI000F73F726|nr:hypothetical protein [Streptomyces sp. WAC 04229]RSN50504.1 hypothetical protein DMH12_24790 [Streptomyces sp. WAC 04229]
MDVHTPANAVPPVDGTELGDCLEDLADIHPGIDLIRDGLRLLAHDRLDLNQTQVLLATLAGSPDSTDLLGAIGHLIARLSNPDTNPALRQLPLDQQKTAAHQGWLTTHNLTDPDLRNSAANANAALDQ